MGGAGRVLPESPEGVNRLRIAPRQLCQNVATPS
jgi:hypothetical protein